MASHDPALPRLLELLDPAGTEVLAPSALEALRPGWGRQAAHGRHAVYLLAAPGPPRLVARRSLAVAGLRVADAMLHLPAVSDTQLLVPLGGDPLRRAALSAALGGPSAKRRALTAAAALPLGARVLAASLPQAALSLRRDGAPSSFAWLFDAAGLPGDGGVVAIEVSWRGLTNGAVLTAWSRARGEPVAVAKVAFGGPDALSAELALLERLAPAAGAAGAAVPLPLGLHQSGAVWALVESWVPGQQVAALLTGDPSRAPEVLARAVPWLEQWHRITTTPGALTRSWLDERLLAPARLLTLSRGAEYEQWLAALADRTAGRACPFVAVHGDLTTANLLWSDDGGLGVVDWAEAGVGLALEDLYYLAIDAERARGATPAEAYDACFAPRSPVTGHAASVRQAAGMDPDLAVIAIHACLLHHARNERGAVNPTSDRPFQAMLERAVGSALG